MSLNAGYEGAFSMPYSEVLGYFKTTLDAAIRAEVPSLGTSDPTGCAACDPLANPTGWTPQASCSKIIIAALNHGYDAIFEHVTHAHWLLDFTPLLLLAVALACAPVLRAASNITPLELVQDTSSRMLAALIFTKRAFSLSSSSVRQPQYPIPAFRPPMSWKMFAEREPR